MERGAERNFAQYRATLSIIVEGIECLHRALRPAADLNEVPGWRELKRRPFLWRQPGEKPWLVATLFGPTGSGKSSLFRVLTGLQVPAGDVIRPVTFNALIAVPEELNQPARLADLFPMHMLEPLREFNQLKDKEQARDVLYYATYAASSAAALDLILADVPDFDTIYRRNWHKAEDMMRRAEVVLFTIYPAAYMDQAVVDNLEKCCRHAGKLAVILSKVDDAEQAELIWRDLLGKVASAPELKIFQEAQRSDGLRLCDFLRASEIYYSVRTQALTLDSVRPLAPRVPDFKSLLCGLEGMQVLWSSLRQDARRGIDSLRTLCDELDERTASLRTKIDLATTHLQHASALVAGTCFPAGEVTRVIADVAREYRPFWVKIAALPVRWFSAAVRQSKQAFDRAFQMRIKPIRQLERERVDEVLDDLLTALRADFPGAGLGMEQCRAVRDQIVEPLPEPSTDWHREVRESVQRWARQNPWRTTVLGSLNDLLLTIGGAAIGLDLLVTGGQGAIWGSLLLSKIGLVGAAGAGSAAAGALLRFFEEMGLRQTLETADASWRRQRSEEIAAYLRRTLAGPLFLQAWEQQLKEWQSIRCAQYRAACRDAESSSAQFLEEAAVEPAAEDSL